MVIKHRGRAGWGLASCWVPMSVPGMGAGRREPFPAAPCSLPASQLRPRHACPSLSMAIEVVWTPAALGSMHVACPRSHFQASSYPLACIRPRLAIQVLDYLLGRVLGCLTFKGTLKALFHVPASQHSSRCCVSEAPGLAPTTAKGQVSVRVPAS